MKIGQRLHWTDEDKKLVVETVNDNAPYLESVKQLKDQGIDGFGENRLVGRIPMHLVNEWLKEAGLKMSDTQAVQDLIRRKLLSGEFDKLRPWEGTF